MNKADIRYSLRSLLRDKSSSITGITGYAVALTCAISVAALTFAFTILLQVDLGPLLFVVPLLTVFVPSLVVTIAQITRIAAIKPGRSESITGFFRS